MAIELATAYVSIVPDTSKVARGIDQALRSSGSSADRVGADIGNRMSSALSKTLKAGAVTAAAATGAGIATALTKGWERLSAIDNAEGKLTSLGHNAVSTAKIMDSALASVKGTSYGLGEAATMAATAVAAGVQPGKDLTRYLSLVADSATIAGVGLGEMGSIFGKVQTQQRAYTMEINMLADRGIPIYQYLQKELGVTQETLKKMVKEGKVDSETYFNAIERNIGGAATAATTVSSQWSNTMAAMGRLGAAALAPTFGRLSGWLGTAITSIDDLTDRVGPLAKAFDSKVFQDWGPRIGEGISTVRDAFDQLSSSGLMASSLTRVQDIFSSLWATAEGLGPSIGQIVVALSKASAAVGVSTWQVLLAALEATAQVAESVLVPALSVVGDLMENNQGAVMALVAAFAAMKVIPSIGAAAAAAFLPLRTAVTSAGASMAGMRATTTAVRSDFSRLAPQIGRTGAMMRTLGTHSSTIRGMQNAFIGSSTAAGGFAAAMRQGVQPALSGVRTAASGVRNLFSGGLGIGLAVVGAMQFVSAMDDMEDSQNANRESAFKLAEAQGKVAEALMGSAGAMSTDVLDALTDQIDEYRQGLERTASEAPGMWNEITNFVMPKWDDDMSLGERWDSWWGGANDALQEAGNLAEETAESFKKLGVSNRDVATAMSGSDGEWTNFVDRLRDVGGASDEVVASIQQQREHYLQTQQAMEQLGPAAGELSSAIDDLADSSASADSKVSALQSALHALLGIPLDAQQAMSAYEEGLEDLVESAAKGADAAGGLGDALLKADGSLDLTQKNARGLLDELSGLVETFQRSAAEGNNTQEMYDRAAEALEALAEKYAMTDDQVRALAESMGLLPRETDLLLGLEGADETRQSLIETQLLLEQFDGDGPATATVKIEDEEARRILDDLGFKVDVINEAEGIVRVTAENDLAMAALQAVADRIRELDTSISTPQVNADDTSFRIVDEATRSSLENIDRTQVSPEIGAVIDQFLAGEAVTLEKLSGLDTSKANPEVLLQIQQALTNAQVISAAIDEAARKRTAEIAVQFAVDYGAARNANPGFVGPLSVTPRANGGIDNLPEHATIKPGRGAGVFQWAEGETGGEAFIPLAQSKRGRSTQILSEVANRFGLRLEKFADGGITRALNAARSVTGNAYVWGGTGPTGFDCSGMVGWIQQILMGMDAAEAAGRRLYTTYSLLGGSSAGLQPGAGPAGTAFVVGVNQEHMAASLAGNNIEAGGAHGTSSLNGPAVGANDGQFTSRFHLPNGAIDGGVGDASLYGYSGYSKPVEWTEKDQIDLESARVSVLQAQEARDKTYANEKKSDADRQQADLKVQRAEIKVRELEDKRDGKGVAAQIVTPAPELTGEMDDDLLSIRRAEIAVLDAQLARDKVYSDPEATSLDKEKADMQVYDARNSLESTKERLAEDSEEGAGANKDGWSQETLRDRVSSYGSQVAGILFDSALDIFGVESRWLDIPWPKYELESDKKKPKKGKKKSEDEVPPAASFPQSELDRQLGFNPEAGIPDWFAQYLKPLPMKVFDNGGWLQPGEVGINLSTKPEPIFNSPEQLRAFAGANLDTLEPAAAQGGNDYSIHVHSPQFANESKMMRSARDLQERNMMRYGGRP